MNDMDANSPLYAFLCRISAVIAFFVMLFLTLALPRPTLAGVAVDCKGSAAAYKLQGIPCDCINGQIVCSGQAKKGVGKGLSSSAQLKGMVFGMMFESMLTSLFTTPQASEAEIQAAQQRAAELAWQQEQEGKAREAAAQAAYDKMMQSYKQLEDTADVQFKTISNSDLQFKTLDGEMEIMAANARKPFDTAGDLIPPMPPEAPSAPTPFFGDTMPTENVQLLINPENDPRVVDLRKANSFIVDNLKKDSEKLAAATKEKAAVKVPDCQKLTQKLNGYIDKRNKFHKTVLMAQEQLNTWEDANRNALVNGVKDGVEYFAGLYLEILKNRGEAAERLRKIYEKKAGEMVRNGVDIQEIEAKITRLKAMSSVGNFADVAATANDWQTFIKDGSSALINQLNSSNQDIKEMLDDPRMQKYFTTDAPELNTLLDISKMAGSGKILGKWVAKKMPLVAMLEISFKQAYNATDWYLSFKRIADANNINGKVTESAQKLQGKIDETFIQLQQCP